MHRSLTPGALIRKARERADLTRAELARRARTSHSAIARYESGQSTPKIDTARRCVDACGFDLRVELVDASPQRQAAADASSARSVEDRLRTNDAFTALATQLRERRMLEERFGGEWPRRWMEEPAMLEHRMDEWEQE